ncbi:putative ribonuclease H protein [Vitis vinifera]|uniref:Putative ribonuclease H protein n=1 Tax=Vitis vinifera TaxID=29760 RepID=A0A438C3F6_VITVI|nr:putative ribonuclease H protein [Vitis vinifera]
MLSQIQGEGKEVWPFEKQRGSITVGLMNLKLMSWNVRGANDVNKRRIVKSVVRKQKVDLVCIQETKIQSMTDGVVKSLGVGEILKIGELLKLLEQLEVCWTVENGQSGYSRAGGDFNVTLAQGREAGKEGDSSYEEVLVSPRWLDQFSNVTQKRLSRPISDHFPITIEGGGKRRGPSPFRFENMWLRVEGFKDLLRSWWQGMVTPWSCHLRKRSPFRYKRYEWGQGSGSGWLYRCFWQFCWEFVKEEVMEMFKEFHEHKTFLKSLNATFLILIPKKGGAEELGDFRPISLLGGLYKLLAKAYDSVNWHFLMRVMEKMGFGTKWREWIWSCISTAKFSVLVNGSQPGFSLALRASTRRPSIPIFVYHGNGGAECSSSEGCGRGLHHGIRMQRAASGLRINLAKSEIIPVGEVDEILEMAVELGCKVGQLPSTYLGLPLGAPNKAGYVWDGVEEMMRWKLALWKRQYLSKGGRITLIKSTLASMPLYQLSLFRMPKGVARRLEKLQRDFLWGGGSTERKAHLVSWEKVGKCTKIRFWKDTWCGDVELARRFPQLFSVAAQKGATMGDLWDQNAGQGEWNLRFLRSFNDWELPLVEELLQILRNQRINLEEDLAVWKGGKNGQFGVTDAYGLLTSHSTILFPKKGIWVENVPSS